MNDLPKRPVSKRTASAASLAAAAAFGAVGWIYRNQEDQEDYGIDAEVQIVAGEQVTGGIFKVQVRGRTIEWRDDLWQMRVKSSTLNLWRQLPVPVLVLVHDAATKAVYWTTPGEATTSPGAASARLHFSKARVLEGELRDVRAHIAGWQAGYGDQHMDEVLHFLRSFRNLEDASVGDWFLDIGPELQDELRLFLRHLIRLRYAMGLTLPPFQRIEYWQAVDQRLDGDERTIRYGILAWLIDVIRPLYFEALQAVRVRLEAAPYDDALWETLTVLQGTNMDLREPTVVATQAVEDVQRALDRVEQRRRESLNSDGSP